MVGNDHVVPWLATIVEIILAPYGEQPLPRLRCTQARQASLCQEQPETRVGFQKTKGILLFSLPCHQASAWCWCWRPCHCWREWGWGGCPRHHVCCLAPKNTHSLQLQETRKWECACIEMGSDTFFDHLFCSLPVHWFVPGLPRHLEKDKQYI